MVADKVHENDMSICVNLIYKLLKRSIYFPPQCLIQRVNFMLRES